jgi:hypothetical protein
MKFEGMRAKWAKWSRKNSAPTPSSFMFSTGSPVAKGICSKNLLRSPSGREEKHTPNRGFRTSIGCRGLAGQPVWGWAS